MRDRERERYEARIAELEAQVEVLKAEGELAHSDRGAHYKARAYREKLAELGLVQSMSRKACCWDNASMESWFGRMKEQIGPTDTLSATEVKEKVDEYVYYYRHCRGQARLGSAGLPPPNMRQSLPHSVSTLRGSLHPMFGAYKRDHVFRGHGVYLVVFLHGLIAAASSPTTAGTERARYSRDRYKR